MKYILQSLFDDVGLSRQEAAVYMESLQSGPVSVTKLANLTAINRVEMYGLIERLSQKGLVREMSGKKIKVIEARHPRELEHLLAQQRRKLKKIELKLEDALPQLAGLYKKSAFRPTIHFYEGIKGLESIHIDIIETLKDCEPEKRVMYSYSNPAILVERFEEYRNRDDGFIEQRQRYGISNKVIAPDNAYNRELHTKDKSELRDMILVPSEVFPYVNDITLYHNKMAIEALQEECIGVVIESKEIYDDQRAVFRLAREGAKVLSRK